MPDEILPRLNVLLAVKSCAGDISAGHNECIRQTWGRHIPPGVTLRFYVGHGTIPLQMDEVRLDCPDGYYSLPEKTRAILRLAIQFEWDFIFLADTDSFIRPERLLASGFERFDLMGYFGARRLGVRTNEGWAWPSGGAGYWLSVKAARIIAQAELDPKDTAEDRQIGQILGPHIASGAIKASNQLGYTASESDINGTTYHYCARGFNRDYDPRWMKRLYKRFYP